MSLYRDWRVRANRALDHQQGVADWPLADVLKALLLTDAGSVLWAEYYLEGHWQEAEA